MSSARSQSKMTPLKDGFSRKALCLIISSHLICILCTICGCVGAWMLSLSAAPPFENIIASFLVLGGALGVGSLFISVVFVFKE